MNYMFRFDPTFCHQQSLHFEHVGKDVTLQSKYHNYNDITVLQTKFTKGLKTGGLFWIILVNNDAPARMG